MKDRRKISWRSTVLGIVLTAVISSIVSVSVAVAAIERHMGDVTIHRNYQALAGIFMPREVLELRFEMLSKSLRRIEVELGTVEE